MAKNLSVRLLVFVCAVTVLPRTAAATAVSSGSSFAVINSIAIGTFVAYGNGVYLVVGARGQANLRGHFIQNGVPIGADFLIQASANYTLYPRAAFSPDADNGAGAFLVSWNETDLANANTSLHVRMVSLAHGGAYGPDVQVSQNPTLWIAGCPVVYSAGSPSGQKKFLVACQAVEGGAWNVEAYFIGNNANVLSGNLIPAQVSENHRDPSIAYNPVTDQFAIVHSGYQQPGFSEAPFVAAKFLRADTGQLLVNRLVLYQSTNTTITKVVYVASTNQYLASWDASGGTYDLLINADWSFGSSVNVVSARFGTYDSLGLAYNPVSHTTLMVGQDLQSLQDGAVEIGLNGIPLNSGFIATNTTNISNGGDLYPEVATNPTAPEWVFSFSHDYLATWAQVVTTAGSTPPPPPTGGGGGGSTSCPGYPTPAFPGAVCGANGGWVPGGATGGTTPPPPPPGGTSCPGYPTPPFPGAVCGTNGGWVNGGASGGTTPPPPPPGGTTCPGYPTPPFPGAVCGTNGGWVNGGATGVTTTPPPPPGGTSCPGYPTPPFPGAVCGTNGGWVNGGATGATTTPPPPPGGTSCPGYPTPPFPGAVCGTNGGWVNGGTTGGGGTTCPGYPNPPFPGAVCGTNGGWVNGGMTAAPTGGTSCPGYPTPPFPGAVCAINGGWVSGGNDD